MIRGARRAVALFLGVTLAVVAVAALFEIAARQRDAPSSVSPSIDGYRHRRFSPISYGYPSTSVAREIEALGRSHEWAGKYIRSTRYAGEVLCVAPTADYDRCCSQDCPPHELDERRGAIEARDDRIGLLGIAPPHDTSTCIVVQWGERRYLLATPDRENFCSAIRDGREPRTTPIGGFFLREGDEHRDAGPPSAIVPADPSR